MEILIAIILGGAVFVGGLAGFIGLFTKGDKEAKQRELEKEIASIKSRLAELENHQANVFQSQTTIVPEPEPEELYAAQIDETLSEIDSKNEQFHDNPPTETSIPSEHEPLQTAAKAQQTNTSTITPNVLDKAFNYAKDWLFGGNTLVRSGIILLFIGVSFLIKYVAENSNVPIEFRMAGIALFGVGLLGLGWRLRNKRTEYAWALQGGGIGVLYLTVFAAMKLYQLIPPSAAFIILIAIAFLSASVAVLQSALPLAILGFTGGFLAPIFTSSGSGSHIGLFSYYLILNLAIAFIAFHKSWRPLNVLGFAFTFVIGTIWGARSYQPDFFVTTEPFLIIHFLLFTLVAVLYARRQATKVNDYVDATLVFGTPLVGFSLQYALVRDTQFGLAYSALVLAIFYVTLAWWVLTQKRMTMQFLGECFLALGIGFATLTLPLALDGRWTSAAWAVEGVGLLWAGLKQKRLLPTLSGLALQLLGAAAFVYGWGLTEYTGTNHQNMYLGVAFIAIAGWACGALLHHYQQQKFSFVANSLTLWGWFWWVGAGLSAIDYFVSERIAMHAALAFIAISSILFPIIANRIQWPRFASLSVLLLPVMGLATTYELFETHPFADFGAISWLIAFSVYLYLLYHQKISQGVYFRAPFVWICAIIFSFEWHYQLQQFAGSAGVWRDIGWAIIPMLLIAGISYWQFKGVALLEGEALSEARTWGWVACAPLMLFVIAWFIYMSLNSDGNAAPLPYLPIVNPLDIALIGALLIFIIWHRPITKYFHSYKKATPIIAGVMGFTLLNGILLRSLHHWFDTPFRWESIFDFPVVQMAFTFMWAITAFVLMLLAHKKSLRIVWIVGAALMGLVVAKIFLLDLAQTGTVERIASFIGAGIMLLIMGYFAPLPPTKSANQVIQ